MRNSALFIGLDFGTESVRAVVVDREGRAVSSATSPYEHGQIVPGCEVADRLFHGGLSPSFALQHPGDWIASAGRACREAIGEGGVDAAAVEGVGVDFTSCTMLPCLADGTPLCLEDGAIGRGEPWQVRTGLGADPHAWPKLWKHHGALRQTDRINAVARDRGEAWLGRYGGIVGLEWLFPKMFEVIEQSADVAGRAEVWLEAGDWFVWQCVGSLAMGGTVNAPDLPRSTCQAGYKGLWSATEGYPSQEFLAAVDPGLADAARSKMPGVMVAPGRQAGELCESMALKLGLRAGIAVSAAIIDAHAGVPGAGVGEAGTLVMVMGTSGCHMLLGEVERQIAGVAGVVQDGILPGFAGYETGQAAMGDGFDLVRRLTGHADFRDLDKAAADVEPGAEGLLCLDWYNGCRTPLMDGGLAGGVIGLTLDHGPEHVYRASLEASAFGLRWIVDTLRDGGIPVERFVATGGLPTHNPLFAKIAASVLGEPISIHAAEHGPALGAAILGALAAGSMRGGFDEPGAAVHAMSGKGSVLPAPRVVGPDAAWAADYEEIYRIYRRFADEQMQAGSSTRLLGALRHKRSRGLPERS